MRDVFMVCIALRKRATRNYATYGSLAGLLTDMIEILAGEPDRPEWR